MNIVVFDTDVASMSVKRELPASLSKRIEGLQPTITFVTHGEMFEWAERNDWGPRRRGALDHWVERQGVLQSDEPVCATWGRINAAAEERGRPRPENDAWIAACCISHGVPLATGNAKDFVDFAEHEGLELIEV